MENAKIQGTLGEFDNGPERKGFRQFGFAKNLIFFVDFWKSLREISGKTQGISLHI